MYSYDWIVLVTRGLDRWAAERQPKPHEIELREALARHEAEKGTEAPNPVRRGLRARLPRLSRRRRDHEAAACTR